MREMGCIIGNQDTIERARFTALPFGRVVKAQSVILLEHRDGGRDGNQVVLIKLENGEFTVAGRYHGPNGNWAVLDYGSSEQDKRVLSGLVKMEFVTQADVDAHIANVAAQTAKRERKYAIESLQRACADLGIPVPDVAP
jgi:hypothetical protein